MEIDAVQGDITRLEVDAIVNAANASLLGGGGVDGAIHRAAGPDLVAECATARWLPDRRRQGHGGLPAPGPVGHPHRRPGVARRRRRASRSCWRRATAGRIEVAGELGAATIAFPAISTGIYGYPKEAAAAVAVETLRSVDTTVERATLVAFDTETLQLYRSLLET